LAIVVGMKKQNDHAEPTKSQTLKKQKLIPFFSDLFTDFPDQTLPAVTFFLCQRLVPAQISDNSFNPQKIMHQLVPQLYLKNPCPLSKIHLPVNRQNTTQLLGVKHWVNKHLLVSINQGVNMKQL